MRRQTHAQDDDATLAAEPDSTKTNARAHQRLLRFALALLALLAVATFARAQDSAQQGAAAQNVSAKKNSCVECHSRLEGKLADPVKQFATDVHAQHGLSCNDCHGGDPTKDDKAAAKDPAHGYIGTPPTNQIPGFCGKCHSDANLMKRFNPSLRVDQEREYWTSVHGRMLKSGETKVATCVSCHNTHGIRPVNDPLSTVYASNVAETCSKCHANAQYMASFKIPTDQYAKYKTSVHAAALYQKQDLSAPTCNDCHGNHGAAPPGLASVSNVCGQCHARQATLFEASPHKAPFDQAQLGECIRCHNNHDIAKPTDQMIGASGASVCVTCHSNGDKGLAAAGRMRSDIDNLSASITGATEILERAERAGVEVSKPKFEMHDAVDGLTNARVVIHSSSVEEVNKVVAPALEVAKKGHEAGVAAFFELNVRRKGLVVSLFFILCLAGLVYLKVRDIERRQPPAAEPGMEPSA